MLAGSVMSPRIARAPAAVTPASVSSERATPATAQPSARSTSITARPRLRAPNTSALRACEVEDSVTGEAYPVSRMQNAPDRDLP